MTPAAETSEAVRAMASRIGVRDAGLIRTRCLIGGEWCGAFDDDAAGKDSNTKTIGVTNPATGELLVTVPRLGAAETHAAIAAASAAFPGWARQPAAARSTLLRRWHDLIVHHGDDLARIMVAEQGKPLAEAAGEVAYAVSFVEWFAEVGL